MISMSVAEIAAVVGGQIVDLEAGQAMPVVSGAVVTDSRQVSPGCLFVATVGEQADGHDFAAAAVHAAAVAVLAQRPVGVPAIVVADTQAALGLLAREVLERLQVPVVGVTGSSGKTSTKDLLAQVLGGLGSVVAAQGSFNNEWGLPLTVLRADANTAVLVLEFGARGLGHIRTLTQIAPPQVSVVLNVGSAHVGEFGSAQVTALAKSELVQALPSAAQGGVAVLNADDARVAGMSAATNAAVLRVGVLAPGQQLQIALQRDLDVWAQQVQLDEQGRASFTLARRTGPDGTVDTAPVNLQVHGRHQVGNAVATAAAAVALGMTLADTAAGLSQAQATSRWRMELRRRADGLTVINDAYNANPESVRAALEATAAMGGARGGNSVRRWAVLGPMRELGPVTHAEHEAVGRLVAQLGFYGLITVEPDAQPIAEAALTAGMAAQRVHQCADWQQSVQVAAQVLGPQDVVVIKASRAVGLERVAQALLAEQQDEQQDEQSQSAQEGNLL